MKEWTKNDLAPELVRRMEEAGIDVALTLSILNNFNAGRYESFQRAHVFNIPALGRDRFFDLHRRTHRVTIDRKKASACCRDLDLDLRPEKFGTVSGPNLVFVKEDLVRLGRALLPRTAYGILNGGSASSYVDRKKNRAFNESLFAFYEKDFERLRGLFQDKPKGVTSAFQNRDGSPGPSFLELKLRALLLLSYRAARSTGARPAAVRLFQMTSVLTDTEIAAFFRGCARSPYLAELAEAVGFDPGDILTGVQPLIAAFTGADEGPEKRIFSRADGRENQPLAMPGGHGQNFLVLKDVYRGLHARGIRFAYLGNIDNLGYTVDPESLALAVLRRCDAAFEFSFRTSIDVKGGVLVAHRDGRLDCADLGPAVPFEKMLTAEKAGRKILFNCAIGLFNLTSLVRDLDRIVTELPVRFSEQDKAAGRYSQAEQITWEVLGLLERPLIFGVNKADRFLAAKLLLEGLLTSGYRIDDPAFPREGESARELHTLAMSLHSGLAEKLRTVYGMAEEAGRWRPKTLEEIDEEISS
ncbi:MAG: UTP--glucose-1-phosphate uridylyltransferase [Spirochaetales bacterium]|nr:UTP--glucose-1-phosphate uridylyltransferase [Spirochaetales bacterium]